MKFLPTAFITAVALAAGATTRAAVTTQPSFQVDQAHPTADKPQSKLWFAGNSWWALLPTTEGPSLWQRTAPGWREHPAIRRDLQGLPGRVDVWSDGAEVTAAGVADRTLAIFSLRAEGSPVSSWRAQHLATWSVPASEAMETVTIARDGAGCWWVAATVTPVTAERPAEVGKTVGKKRAAPARPRNVVVWTSSDRVKWTQLPPLETGIGGDDICTVTPVPGGIGVAWSDQVRDRVGFRRHGDGQATSDWAPVEIAEAGGRTADDHLHAALAGDGTLWLATKNSVDQADAPQLVLRIRSRDGLWQNLPYLPRTSAAEPSRPVVIAAADPKVLLLGHTVYDRSDPFKGRIVFGRVARGDDRVLPSAVTVIAPDPALRARINDITTPKAPFPADAPWIVLASDAEGRVYEADLRSLGTGVAALGNGDGSPRLVR